MDARGALGGRRVLLVDDDSELRGSLCDLLRSDGYEVVAATNGSDALERLHQGPLPDLIVLDLVMPVKDGWQFRIEQKSDPAISSIPVLAMSADDTPKAAAIDADLYIRKPFQYPALLDAIHRVIENRRLLHIDRMASLGTLAAGIAHEINNPLTYVIANLQLVQEEMSRRFQEYREAVWAGQGAEGPEPLESAQSLRELAARLRDALEGAERIRSIVLDVKTFSRAADDHRTLIDVRSVIDSAVRVVFAEIRQKAHLVKEYKHIPLVMANPGQLGQVFVNLLLNAAHAIGEGGPEKNVIRVVTGTSPPDQVVVEVSDSGNGIAPQVLHRIFDPFFTTKPLGIGTGLGLSVCHGIVHSLGGRISVESEVGHGTTFRIVLPSSSERAHSSQPPPLYGPEPSSRGRVLIIDDEPQLAHVVKLLLQPDHDASVATSCVKAFELLTAESDGSGFDVILCDLHMPGMSGMDLYEKLVGTHPHVAERMVFMTGGTFTPRSRDFVSGIKNPCIDKPVDAAEIRALVSRRVAKSS